MAMEMTPMKPGGAPDLGHHRVTAPTDDDACDLRQGLLISTVVASVVAGRQWWELRRRAGTQARGRESDSTEPLDH